MARACISQVALSAPLRGGLDDWCLAVAALSEYRRTLPAGAITRRAGGDDALRWREDASSAQVKKRKGYAS